MYDPAHDELQVRIRRRWPEIDDQLHREIIELTDDTLKALQKEMGNAALLEYFENTLSNVLMVSNRLSFHPAATIEELADRLAETLLSPPVDISG